MMFSLQFADIHQIVSDPVQAVTDAVDEVSSLLNKFHGADKWLSVSSVTVAGEHM